MEHILDYIKERYTANILGIRQNIIYVDIVNKETIKTINDDIRNKFGPVDIEVRSFMG